MLETATRFERASSDVGNRRSSFELRGQERKADPQARLYTLGGNASAPKMAIHEWFPQLGLDGTLTLLAL
jgi:hypothetical protein